MLGTTRKIQYCIIREWPWLSMQSRASIGVVHCVSRPLAAGCVSRDTTTVRAAGIRRRRRSWRHQSTLHRLRTPDASMARVVPLHPQRALQPEPATCCMHARTGRTQACRARIACAPAGRQPVSYPIRTSGRLGAGPRDTSPWFPNPKISCPSAGGVNAWCSLVTVISSHGVAPSRSSPNAIALAKIVTCVTVQKP